MTAKMNRERIPVYKIDMETEAIIEEYDSICEAARAHDTRPGAISRVVQGFRKQHAGFYWEKQEDPIIKVCRTTYKKYPRRKKD